IGKKQDQTTLPYGKLYILIQSAEITFKEVSLDLIQCFRYFTQLPGFIVGCYFVFRFTAESHKPCPVIFFQNDMTERHDSIYGIIQQTKPVKRHLHCSSLINHQKYPL